MNKREQGETSKIPDEIIKLAKPVIDNMAYNGSWDTSQMYEMFYAGYSLSAGQEKGEQPEGWREAKKEPPEISQHFETISTSEEVLVFDTVHGVEKGWLKRYDKNSQSFDTLNPHKKGDTVFEGQQYAFHNVTHWMPLPKPPGELETARKGEQPDNQFLTTQFPGKDGSDIHKPNEQAELTAWLQKHNISGLSAQEKFALKEVFNAGVETARKGMRDDDHKNWPPCERCSGEGTIERNIQRDGYPEMDVPVYCDECKGLGVRPPPKSEPAGEKMQDELWDDIIGNVAHNFGIHAGWETTRDELKSKYIIQKREP